MSKKKEAKLERAKVYIVGETPMVEEYVEACSAHGYDVAFSWNSQPTLKPKLHARSTKSDKIPGNCSLGIELTNSDLQTKKKNLQKLDAALPPTSAILSSSVIVTATEQSSWIRGKHRLVGICALPSLSQKPLVEVAPTVFSPKETLEVVATFYRSIDKEIEMVQDRVGMVLPRILCQMINESAFALTEDIASPQDIDRAMKLGANYPRGPIEWAEQIGIKQVYAVLNALHDDLREERYRVSPLLKQLATTGDVWIRKSE